VTFLSRRRDSKRAVTLRHVVEVELLPLTAAATGNGSAG
jgi:hypothetical protein